MGEPMDRSKRIFVKFGSFEKAYPTLQSVTVESYEDGDGVFRAFSDSPNRTFGNPRPWTGGLLLCSNPSCRRGGFEVDFDVHDMVREKLVTKEFVKRCPGDEGSPKGRRRGRRCLNTLHCRATLTYKQEPKQE